MVVLIILLCAAICIFEVGKIIYVVMYEKKEENINNSENDNSENDKEK